ncbi:MAG: hypothetical protein J7K49_00900 [Thaumarchaeota archaeon]|nr:hypothetical protein [Nitrososphaerota archaeon]
MKSWRRLSAGGRKGERMKIFVDTAWNSKPHACYDPQSDDFFEVERLTDLRDYDEIYLDSLLFPGIWSELEELIADGHGVYHFTRPWKWKELRKRFKDDLREKLKVKDIRKSDYSDAYILWKVYDVGIAKGDVHKWFKRITMIDVELKPLLMIERRYEESLRRARQDASLGIDVTADIELFEDKVQRIRRMIVAKAEEVWPKFVEIMDRLGLDEDDLRGLTGIAGTLTYLGWPLRRPSIQKAIHYFGLYRPSRRDMLKFMKRTGKRFQKRYNGSARRYLNMLAVAVLAKEGRYPPKAKGEKEVLRRLIKALKELESAEV